jgi:iron complex transport system substrate-binding protein
MTTRIVSLTPSITETLFALDIGDRVVGVTDACDYPFEANAKPHVCSWFKPDMDRIKSLDPDLIFGLETAHQHIRPFLEPMGIQLQLFNARSVPDALADILNLGKLLDEEVGAYKLVSGLQHRLDNLARRVGRITPSERPSVSRVLEIGNDKLMVAGPQSFQYDVIALGGGVNVSTGIDGAYPKVSFKQFKTWDPDIVFICGSDKHRVPRLKLDPKWRSLKSVRNGRLYQFPCGLTCRTGPRIVDMAELLFQTLEMGRTSKG